MTAADVFKRPAPGPSRDYRFPAFERLTLSNGLGVVVAPVSKLPIATVVALVDAGAAADPPGQEGVALLTARALAEGTERSDGADLAARFERLGTALDASADWDSAALRISMVTSERLPAALALLAEVIRVPKLPRTGGRATPAGASRRAAGQRADQPRSDDMFKSRGCTRRPGMRCPMAAPSRPWAHSIAGGRTFYGDQYSASSTTVIIVGDTTRGARAPHGDRRLRFLGKPDVRQVAVTDQLAATTRTVHVVGKADAPQSELRVGHVGVPRLHRIISRSW